MTPQRSLHVVPKSKPSVGARLGARLSAFWAAVLRVVRTARGAQLHHEVTNQLPVLPVLSEQLRATASQIEQAIVTTCANFQTMATRAEASVTAARSAMGEDGAHDGSFDATISTARQTLEQLLQRSMQSAELSRQAAVRVEEAEKAMGRIVEISRQVDTIAFGIKILAINAKIQAVHVGENGAGFGVVADEIARHAEDSTKIADDIRTTVETQNRGIRETRETLTTLATTSLEGVTLSQREVRQALDVLQSTNARMHASVGQAADTSRELARDIAQAVTNLQFQDRVTQRLAHVQEAIVNIHGSLSAAARGTAPQVHTETSPTMNTSSALEKLQASYTMAEEHAPLAPTGTEDGSGSVELF